MQLHTGQRTFYVGVSGILGTGAQGKGTEIPFVDSAGNSMRCNYFQVEVAGGNNNDSGIYAVEVSGVRKEGNIVDSIISPVEPYPSMETSGICGTGSIIRPANDYVIWHGSNGEVATGVRVQLKTALGELGLKSKVVVIYGNLFPLNPRRLEQSYDAGV